MLKRRSLKALSGSLSVAFVLHASAATPAGANPAPGLSSQVPVLLVLGDSLSAEYGIARGSGWVALLRARLSAEGAHYTVVNASISGDTTSDGRGRLPALLTRLHPSLVLIELGANDALRGIPLELTADNLRFMIDQSRAANARVVLIGMQIPPNFGSDYTQKFHALYPQLAHQEHIALVPFLLDGIATQPDMFQADQMHPTEAAQGQLLNNVYPVLKPLLAHAH